MNTFRRLADLFSPSNYKLHINLTEADQKKFTGQVEISGTLHSGDYIVLHSKDLTIEQILVGSAPVEFSYGENDELVIADNSPTPGERVVKIIFSGVITDAMHGLYPCYYNHQGQTKYLLSTQFESHHAREAFPCVDEPSAKATYDVSLTTTGEQTVLGNMPIIEQHSQADSTTTTFATTPIMSSYLLAFAVGDLHKKSAKTKRGIETNVWAGPHQSSESLDFALDIATRAIDFFEEYFGVEYPLPKSDHIALPDFSTGAMENWGLITYRESCLIYEPSQTSENDKRYIATVIVHELSHQWFGNLVTMEWWNGLWLNESFANMMEYLAVDALEPSWHIWEDFATNEVMSAMRRDSLNGVQSVKVDVNHPDEINSLFDPSIVYAKGGRLLKMVQQLVGDQSFRSGLKSYFENFAYKNAKGDDLWQALETASGLPVLKIMNQWITQPGFPMITVSSNQESTTLTQKRFFVGEHSEDNSLWPIPLFSNQPDFDEILDVREKTFTRHGDILLNQGLGAHFITNYSDNDRQNILNQITSGQLSVLDKICFLQDSPLLVRAGIIPSANLLPLALSFQNEPNEKVYTLAIASLNEMRKFIEDDEEYKAKFKLISGDFARPTLNKLGWDGVANESDDDREKRSSALALMSYSEDVATLNEAKRRFDSGVEDVSPEIRSIILSATVRNFETPEMIDYLFNLHRETSSSDFQQDLALAITSTKKFETASRALDSIKDKLIIRPQDSSYWYVYLLRNSSTRSQTWKWLRDNWDWVERTFGGDKSYDKFVRYTGSSLRTRTELEEFIDFFEPKMNKPSLKRAIELAINELSAMVELIDRDKSAVIDAISSYQPR